VRQEETLIDERACCDLARIDWFTPELQMQAMETEDKKERMQRIKLQKDTKLEAWIKYKTKFLEKTPNKEMWKGVPIADDYHLRIDFTHEDLNIQND
jgi:hypothetical protein